MMASGKSAKKARRALPVVTQREGLPWLTITAVTIIVALAAVIFVVVFNAKQDKNQAAAAEQALVDSLVAWQPTEENQDPSKAIDGIYVGEYKVGLHVVDPARVAYDRYPPVGGPHDQEWADCTGVVYTTAVRNENMVHTLEHGAIWITYNPDTIATGDLAVLSALVDGRGFTTLTPYPGLTSPISLQAWGHQLFLDSASDPRVRQFMTALQQNQYLTPEPNGTCSQPTFDTQNPPAFVADPPGPDAVQMDGNAGTGGTAGATQDTGEYATEATATAATDTADSGAAPTGTDTVDATPTSGGSATETTTTAASTETAATTG